MYNDKIGDGSLALRVETGRKLADIAHFLRTSPRAQKIEVGTLVVRLVALGPTPRTFTRFKTQLRVLTAFLA